MLVESSNADRREVSARRLLLQVPETCAWNPYVALAEEHLARYGYHAIRPGMCRDEPDADTGPTRLDDDAIPQVVHLHWPEKLGRQLGFEAALELLDRLMAAGVQVVQTVHNLQPHEAPDAAELAAFVAAVDRRTSGVHFFSAEHERLTRALRPRLPARSILLAHPRYPAVDALAAAPAPGPQRHDGAVIGCFGRLRGYKRTDTFARAFARHAGPSHRLVVAGYPDDRDAHLQLGRLAASDPRIRYLPGFHSQGRFLGLLRGVDWVALPYRRLWSSGVLVCALQLGRRILCPRPAGAESYGLGCGDGVFVDPWDDDAAMDRWLQAALIDPGPAVSAAGLRLPTWDEAARRLAAFYDELLDTDPTGRPAARQSAGDPFPGRSPSG